MRSLIRKFTPGFKKVILARVIPNNSPYFPDSAATVLIPGLKIHLFSQGLTVFHICYENEVIQLTEENASSTEFSYSSNSDIMANSGSYPGCLGAREASQPIISVGVYMGILLSKGSHTEFRHNETVLAGEPFAISDSPEANEFKKEHPEYIGLPVIKYDEKSGTFTDLKGDKIKFPNDVMSLENPEHCELADKAYKDHLGKLAEEYDLKEAHKQKMLKMEEESKKNPSSSPTYTDYKPVSRERDPWSNHFPD